MHSNVANSHDHSHQKGDQDQLLVQNMILPITALIEAAPKQSVMELRGQKDGRIPDPQLAQRRKC